MTDIPARAAEGAETLDIPRRGRVWGRTFSCP